MESNLCCFTIRVWGYFLLIFFSLSSFFSINLFYNHMLCFGWLWLWLWHTHKNKVSLINVLLNDFFLSVFFFQFSLFLIYKKVFRRAFPFKRLVIIIIFSILFNLSLLFIICKLLSNNIYIIWQTKELKIYLYIVLIKK